MRIYKCDNIHVMLDSEDIIEYDNMINDKSNSYILGRGAALDVSTLH